MSANIIKIPLAHAFNLSLQQGFVPWELKIGKITPIFKSGKKGNLSNYRPISVLPVLSKVLEKIVNTRLVSFLDRFNLLYPLQFGFRKTYSTEHALAYTVSNIINALNNGQFSLSLFLDLSQAFDLVHHTILMRKLEHYGIRGVPLQWFKSYLSKRKQFVSIRGSSSSIAEIFSGVPQGAVLAPTLFALFINDLHNSVSIGEPILFADDTTINITNRHIMQLFAQAKVVLHEIESWCHSKKLR